MSLMLTAFVAELRADPRYAAVAEQFAEAFAATDIEADGNLDSLKFLSAVEWVAGQSSKTVTQRLHVMDRLLALKGKVEIRLPEFLGW
jgi:hypothetical protein